MSEAQAPVVSTGCFSLDNALGIGGLPQGRIVELFGKESGGKSTLALHIVSQAQKRGGVCAYVDVEHSLDYGYAKNLGVDMENLMSVQPDYGEQALDIVDIPGTK